MLHSRQRVKALSNGLRPQALNHLAQLVAVMVALDKKKIRRLFFL